MYCMLERGTTAHLLRLFLEIIDLGGQSRNLILLILTLTCFGSSSGKTRFLITSKKISRHKLTLSIASITLMVMVTNKRKKKHNKSLLWQRIMLNPLKLGVKVLPRKILSLQLSLAWPKEVHPKQKEWAHRRQDQCIQLLILEKMLRMKFKMRVRKRHLLIPKCGPFTITIVRSFLINSLNKLKS